MGKVRLEGYLAVPSDRFDQIAAALPDHIALTRAEPGCLRFEVDHDSAAPEKLRVSEVFVDQAALEQHQARAKASLWGQVTASLDRHYTITTDATENLAETDVQLAAERFSVPDIVRQRAMTEGEPGLEWLASLDDVLTGIERDWQITLGPTLAGGSAAFVAEATTFDGVPVVLKLGTPATAAGRQEAEVLRHAAGKGYAQLLRHDSAHRPLLLERLGERLDTLDLPYERQVDIMCATLLHAWMPVPADFTGMTGADKANSLAESILRLWAGAGQPCTQLVIDKALMYCRDRAAAYRPQSAVLAHGDPHAGNTLVVPDTANPVQYKFIDPDGLAIEPAYDLGVLLRAWHDGVAGRHAHDIARAHARHLTTRTQVPSEPIWQWGFIERVSTGLHLLAIGQADEGRTFLSIAEAIATTAG